MTSASTTTLYKAPRTDVSQNQGQFRIYLNFPGRTLPAHDDHGYGPLATVVESFMDPDTLILGVADPHPLTEALVLKREAGACRCIPVVDGFLRNDIPFGATVGDLVRLGRPESATALA